MKRYKGFYPFWYIEKKNDERVKKFKRYLSLIFIINLIFAPNMFKKVEDFSLKTKEEMSYKGENALDDLGFLSNKNISDFKIENKKLEFKILKNDFKNDFKDLEKKINIRSVEDVLEEDTYLIKGEFYGK